MTTVHLMLARILTEQTRPGQVVSTRELRQWYRQSGRADRLLPSQHARGADGTPPLCAACAKTPLLERFFPVSGGHPAYRVLAADPATDLAAPTRSDHALIQASLAAQRDQVLSLRQLEALLQAYLKTHQLAQALSRQSLLRHAEGGECRQCRQQGYLFRREQREHYRILAPAEVDALPTLRTQQIPLPLLLSVAREQGVATEMMRGLLPWLVQQTGRSAAELEAEWQTLAQTPSLPALSSPQRLIERLWSSHSLADWQSWESVYLRHVTQPVSEWIFEETLPARFSERPESICFQALLANFLHWFIGRRPALEAEYTRRAQALAAAGTACDRALVALSQRQHAAPEVLLEIVSSWPGLQGDDAFSSGLLALLMPRRFMTVSRPSLWALRILQQQALVDLPVLLSEQPPELSALAQLQEWAVAECQRRNHQWASDWLTPRRLDRCLYALRDWLPQTLVTGLSHKKVYTGPLAGEEIKQGLIQLYGEATPTEFRAVRRASRRLRALPALPACLLPVE